MRCQEDAQDLSIRAGGEGSSIASYLKGQGRLGALSKPTSPTFVEGTGRVVNTIPPSDFTFWEMLHEAVQTQPADAMDPEIAGQIAAIGIVKGKPFNPDARMKRILTEALAVGNAVGRAVSRVAVRLRVLTITVPNRTGSMACSSVAMNS